MYSTRAWPKPAAARWTFSGPHAISPKSPLIGSHHVGFIEEFMSELTGGDKQPGRFEDNDYRLAAAALLIHAATIDGNAADAERARLRAVLNPISRSTTQQPTN